MFVVIDGERIVNLKNVSTISVDRDKSRIAFNFNYSINIPLAGSTKTVPGYIYWNFKSGSLKELYGAYDKLKSSAYVRTHFVERDDYNPGFINLEAVTSVHFSEQRQCVIFNMNNPVYVYDKDQPDRRKNIGDVIFVNPNDYNDYVKTVRSKMTCL